MDKGKTNAEAIVDIAKRKTLTAPDGTLLTHFHLGHLDPEDLNSEADTAPKQIVDFSCGTAIWGTAPVSTPRATIVDSYEEPGY